MFRSFSASCHAAGTGAWSRAAYNASLTWRIMGTASTKLARQTRPQLFAPLAARPLNRLRLQEIPKPGQIYYKNTLSAIWGFPVICSAEILISNIMRILDSRIIICLKKCPLGTCLNGSGS